MYDDELSEKNKINLREWLIKKVINPILTS